MGSLDFDCVEANRLIIVESGRRAWCGRYLRMVLFVFHSLVTLPKHRVLFRSRHVRVGNSGRANGHSTCFGYSFDFFVLVLLTS